MSFALDTSVGSAVVLGLLAVFTKHVWISHFLQGFLWDVLLLPCSNPKRQFVLCERGRRTCLSSQLEDDWRKE